MSLNPQEIGPIPEETARVAYAAYPKGNVWMRIRDELGTMYQDEAFAHLFSHTGQPAEAPWLCWLLDTSVQKPAGTELGGTPCP